MGQRPIHHCECSFFLAYERTSVLCVVKAHMNRALYSPGAVKRSQISRDTKRKNGFNIQLITLGTKEKYMMLSFGFVYTDLCFRHGRLSWLLTACPSRRCCVCHGFVFHGIDLIVAFAVNFDWKLCYPSCELAICLVFSLVLGLNLFCMV